MELVTYLQMHESYEKKITYADVVYARSINVLQV